MRIVRETVAKLGIAGELIVFLWKRKLWWLIPMVAVLSGVRDRDRGGRIDRRRAVRIHAVLGVLSRLCLSSPSLDTCSI